MDEHLENLMNFEQFEKVNQEKQVLINEKLDKLFANFHEHGDLNEELKLFDLMFNDEQCYQSKMQAILAMDVHRGQKLFTSVTIEFTSDNLEYVEELSIFGITEITKIHALLGKVIEKYEATEKTLLEEIKKVYLEVNKSFTIST